MTVMVQVRAVAGDRNVGGVTQPVLTNRQVQHEIRLAEGETNILGGIITDTEATSLNGLPGLKNIPILRYFFSQEQKSRDQTEIIIMLTPHILRMPNISAGTYAVSTRDPKPSRGFAQVRRCRPLVRLQRAAFLCQVRLRLRNRPPGSLLLQRLRRPERRQRRLIRNRKPNGRLIRLSRLRRHRSRCRQRERKR